MLINKLKITQKLSRNICKLSVMKILSYKQVKKSIDKKANNIPSTYM